MAFGVEKRRPHGIFLHSVGVVIAVDLDHELGRVRAEIGMITERYIPPKIHTCECLTHGNPHPAFGFAHSLAQFARPYDSQRGK